MGVGVMGPFGFGSAWLDVTVRVVLIDEADTTPLVGMLLLESHSLNIDVEDGEQTRPTVPARTESERFLILSSLVGGGGFEPPTSCL